MVESRESAPHHQFVPTISELIAAQMDATGRSYRELSKASGDRVKYQTFQELRTAPTISCDSCALPANARPPIASCSVKRGLIRDM